MNEIEKKEKSKICCSFLTKKHKVLGRSKKVKLITDILFIILASTIIAFIINLHYLNQYRRNIVLDIKSENQDMISGDIEKFELDYKNNNKEDLENVSIEVMLPENFKIKNVIPENIFNKDTNTFKIERIDSGDSGKIEITGIIFGEINTQQKISFRLKYKKQGIMQSALNSLIYDIKDSKLKMDVNLPDKIYKNSPFDAKISLNNTSENDFENIKIKLTSKDFNIDEIYSDENINVKNNTITINKLETNKTIDINMNLVTNNDNTAEILLENFIFYNEKDYKQNKFTRIIEVEKPAFEVNAKTDEQCINDYDKVKFQINYINNENTNIKNVKIKILSDENSNIKNISISNNTNIYLENNEIIFKNDIEKNESGKIDLELNLVRKNLKINQETYLILENEYYRNNDLINYKINSQKIKILSNINVSSKAYYYSEKGDQLGIGPIPPAVDIPTKYWIFWKVSNFGNDLNNFSMSAQLPENIVWTGNKSVLSGNLQYNENNKRIVWNINQIDKDNNEYKIGFEISLTPEINDVGKILEILKNIEYSTKDTFCDAEISKNLENLNTNLKYDLFSNGKGQVIELK